MLVGVTGGTGFIGRRLVARHLAAGDRVRVLCGQTQQAAGRVYNLSDWCTIERFVEAIAGPLKVRVPARRLPEAPVRLAARALGVLPGWPLRESRVDALVNRSRYSTERIECELKYEHSVSVPEGLAHMFAEASIA